MNSSTLVHREIDDYMNVINDHHAEAGVCPLSTSSASIFIAPQLTQPTKPPGIHPRPSQLTPKHLCCNYCKYIAHMSMAICVWINHRPSASSIMITAWIRWWLTFRWTKFCSASFTPLMLDSIEFVHHKLTHRWYSDNVVLYLQWFSSNEELYDNFNAKSIIDVIFLDVVLNRENGESGRVSGPFVRNVLSVMSI